MPTPIRSPPPAFAIYSDPLNCSSSRSSAPRSEYSVADSRPISPIPSSLAPSEIQYAPHRTRPAFRTPSSIRALQLSSPSEIGSLKEGLKEYNLAGQRKWSTVAAKRAGRVNGYPKNVEVADEEDEEVDDGSSLMEDEKIMLRRIMEARRLQEMERLTSNSSRMSERTTGPGHTPLVLLHVSILECPMPAYSREALEKYAPKWVLDNYHLLREKLGEAVLSRGVLVPHPGEEYDLLEERLLEALELCAPRLLGCGHFYADSDTDVEEDCRSTDESGQQVSNNPRAICDYAHEDMPKDDSKVDVCETCEHPMRLPYRGAGNGTQRWDVKFFAANGLMRAGAWSAAWREMERVDVEITPWMPQEVKRALDQALEGEHNAAIAEHHKMEQQLEIMKHEMRAARQRAQQMEENMRAADEERANNEIKAHADQPEAFSEKLVQPMEPTNDEIQRLGSDIPLDQLLKNYIYLIISDKRNIAVAVLSVLVLLLSMGLAGQSVSTPHVPTDAISITTLAETFPTQSMPTAIMSSPSAQIQQETTISPVPYSMSQQESMPSADPEITGSTTDVSDTAATLHIAPSIHPELALA